MKPKTKKKHVVAEKKNYSKGYIWGGILVLVISLVLYQFLGTGNFPDSSATDSENVSGYASSIDVERGKMLALQYCQSCHLLPDPAMLDKQHWEKFLPNMALQLGIYSHRGESYRDIPPPEELDFYPKKAALNETEWQQILDYYTTLAPKVLAPQNKPAAIQRTLPFFSVLSAPGFMHRPKMIVTYVKIDDSVKPSRLFVFDSSSNQLFLLNNKMEILDSIRTDGAIVNMAFGKKEILACTIGTELRGSSSKTGKVFRLSVDKLGKLKVGAALFTNLQRSVEVVPADLNGDNQTDYVICEFGNLTGSLVWMENKGSKKFVEHVIRNKPGSVMALVDESQHGKSPDLWVLFSQGDESIFHFVNKGNGTFEAKQVLRFPSIYGSTSFSMIDMNSDGFKDVVYTAGDNADATKVLKPYHGVYVYLNDRQEHFEQKYFYPINGCYKAIVHDFDNNGTIDIAAIGLFTDEKQPEEGFVYLKNEGGLKFIPYGLPPDTNVERVLTMESGDFDQDTKTDLILGNAFLANGPFGYNKQEAMFVVLKNLRRIR